MEEAWMCTLPSFEKHWKKIRTLK